MKPHNSAPVMLPQSGLPDVAPEAGSNGSSLDERATGEDIEEHQYDPIPPKKTVSVSVRYRIRGRGHLLSYPLDESDGQ